MKTILAAVGFGAALLMAAPALAGEAVCYNTDEGEYNCWFEPHGGGWFTISADGYTTYYVSISSRASLGPTRPSRARRRRHAARPVLPRARAAGVLAQPGHLARNLRLVAQLDGQDVLEMAAELRRRDVRQVLRQLRDHGLLHLL